MASPITTELRVTIDGTAQAAAGLRQVQNASQQLAATAETSGERITSLSKLLGHVGGAGRYEFMAIRGLSEALDMYEAGGARAAASTALMTAGFAAAAVGAGLLVSKVRELSAEISAIESAGGQRQTNLFERLTTGWSELLYGPREQRTGPIEGARRDEESARAATVFAGGYFDAQTRVESEREEFVRRFAELEREYGLKIASERKELLLQEIRTRRENERAAKAEAERAHAERLRNIREEANALIDGPLAARKSAEQKYREEAARLTGPMRPDDYSRLYARYAVEEARADVARDIAESRRAAQFERQRSALDRFADDLREDIRSPKFTSAMQQGSVAAQEVIDRFRYGTDRSFETQQLRAIEAQIQSLAETRIISRAIQNLANKGVIVKTL